MLKKVDESEIFGFIRPVVDVHTLGISSVAKLVSDCGFKVCIGDAGIADATGKFASIDSISMVGHWICANNISRLGFSYRLDPDDACENFGRIYHLLKEYRHFREQGGLLNQVYFAGLPAACSKITREYNNEVPVFSGDESQVETLRKLGIPSEKIPQEVNHGSKYDDERFAFASELIRSGKWEYQLPPARMNYPSFGTFKDTVVVRISHGRMSGRPPLMRVHVGPYQKNYVEAKKEFKSWLRELSDAGFLDVVSIGSSQLSQSDFGTDWQGKPNGGGVPINSEQDLREIWEASRPMLVRTYAGTRNIPYLAGVYESTINIAWHALSFWWFNQIDGRGPYSVKQNLEQHLETLNVIARSGKPFEPNIPHHFSFRGGDDYTYVLSAYLAAITAKKAGVRYLVLQTMLNTPKYTLGVQDLAKARALLRLVRELEDNSFTVFLQPRAGLDYFSSDLDRAKIQLASVSAMMDDIEPGNPLSPDIIHVVSYCEAVSLATPEIINESIQITLNAIREYRKQKVAGHMDSMRNNAEVNERTADLYKEVKSIVSLIEANITDPYSAEGLYTILRSGIMPVPYLWEGKTEFSEAVKWNTAMVNGGIKVVDEQGIPVSPTNRVNQILFNR